MTIGALLIVDSREQRPYMFANCASKFVNFTIVHEGLPEGDYAARLADEDGPEATAVAERKSLPDLIGTLTTGRERFERELQRLTQYGFAALVVEDNLQTIAHYRGMSGRVNPKSIVASLIAFQQRYGIHIIFAGNRIYAEAYVYRLLERWVRDRAAARIGQHAVTV